MTGDDLKGHRWAGAFSTVAWAGAVLLGLVGLLRYGSTAGADARAPAIWPADSRIPRRAHPTALLFVHPNCPCSRATLAELARLLAVVGDRVDVHVVLSAPGDALRAAAAAIAGVALFDDPEGVEARRFGATTSGDLLLYTSGGRLAFQGGITRARGHEGDSSGAAAVIGHLRGRPAPSRAPVYGCPLFAGTGGADA